MSTRRWWYAPPRTSCAHAGSSAASTPPTASRSSSALHASRRHRARSPGSSRQPPSRANRFARHTGDERHRRLHPRVERGGEPSGGPRGTARRTTGRRRGRGRRRVDRPHRRRLARARRAGRVARLEPGSALRDRRRLPIRARPRLRVLRPRRRRRPAPRARAEAPPGPRARGRVRRRGRVSVRLGRGLSALSLCTERAAPPRDCGAPARDAARPRPPVRRRDERSLRREPQRTPAARGPVHEPRARSRGADPRHRSRPAPRRGAGDDGGARERRVEAPRLQSRQARCHRGGDARRRALRPRAAPSPVTGARAPQLRHDGFVAVNQGFADVLEANADYARDFSRTGLTGSAARGLAVLTCMDSRIDPLAMLGLEAGDAKILRNAGARVTDDVLRTLVLASYLLAVRRVMVVAHTGCRMAAGSEEKIHDDIADAGGPDTRSMSFLVTDDQEESLRADVQRVRSSPYLANVTAGGFLYDLATGRLRRVC